MKQSGLLSFEAILSVFMTGVFISYFILAFQVKYDVEHSLKKLVHQLYSVLMLKQMMHDMVMEMRPILCQFPIHIQNQTLQLDQQVVFKIDVFENNTYIKFLAAKGYVDWFKDKSMLQEMWQESRLFLLKDTHHTYLFDFSKSLPETLHTPFWGIAVRSTQWVIRQLKNEAQLLAKFEGHPQVVLNGFETLHIELTSQFKLMVKLKPYLLPSLNWEFKLCNN
jgi:hypothetical protein